MCTLCDRGKPQLHSTSRRDFLKGTAATGLAAGALGLFGSSAAAQGHSVNPPPHTGRPGRRYVIRNGYVMTMEPGTPGANSAFGEFIEGDVLVEGKTIKAIGQNHLQPETPPRSTPAARSSCPDSSTPTTTRPGRRSEARFPTAS